MIETGTVRVEQPEPGVAVIRLSRPDQLNALTAEMFSDIRTVCAHLLAEESVRAIVLTGSGPGFCAGYDLDEARELAELTPAEMLARQHLAQASVVAIRQIRQPVIAAVNGAAVGGGLSLALAADLRIAGQSARFSAAFIRLGLSAGDMGCSWLLPRIVGPGRAAELMFTGKTIDAPEAERIGLVNHIVADDALVPEAIALARSVAQHSPFAMTISKRALQASLEAPSLQLALELEARGQALASRGADFPEALARVRAQLRR